MKPFWFIHFRSDVAGEEAFGRLDVALGLVLSLPGEEVVEHAFDFLVVAHAIHRLHADAAVAGPDGLVVGRVGMRHEHAGFRIAVDQQQIVGQARAIGVADALFGHDELRRCG